MKRSPPQTEDELMQRANALVGLHLEELAAELEIDVPETLLHDKGWCGQLLEAALGTSAQNLSQPDFLELGIELKTIPIDNTGSPLESTYVTIVPMLAQAGHWHDSVVWHKLRRVLWVPILTEVKSPVAKRLICTPILWSPSEIEESLLRADWEDLMERVTLGGLTTISARVGNVLQIRPKAANAEALSWGIGEEGERVQTLPRGFYLRPQFTRSILLKNS